MTRKQNEQTATVHYILTFICFVVAIGSFASHLFTGRQAVVQFDSLTGSLILGLVFLAYAGWFVYTDHIVENISLSESFKHNLKTNATLIFILLYWIILVIIPFLCNIF